MPARKKRWEIRGFDLGRGRDAWICHVWIGVQTASQPKPEQHMVKVYGRWWWWAMWKGRRAAIRLAKELMGAP